MMNKFSKTSLALCAALPVLAFSATSSAAMDPYIESALINVCKSTLSNKVFQFKKTTKSYRLDDKVVALNVMCNGDDIISFAEKHHADKTAAHLQKSIGSVNIIDVAMTKKLSVTFDE